MTTNFLAPEARYASVPGAQVAELKQLIQALHARGIAVFMDVVYNHSGEQGPWRDGNRLAAKCYNLMCQALPQVYRPTAGRARFHQRHRHRRRSRLLRRIALHQATGHRLPGALVPGLWRRRLSLRPRPNPRRRLHRCRRLGRQRPRFAAAHLHAEPWDLGGQWYDFMDSHGWSAANNRWAKWLGAYRDQMRLFSQSGLRSPVDFKRLIEGYGATGRGGSTASSRPWRSVNFLAVHDGYTLRDCTFFNDSDGSQNCWDSGGDENLRREREKLLIGLLLTSQGVPILLQGDEFGATKSGAADQEGARNSYNYEAEPPDPGSTRSTWSTGACWTGTTACPPKGRPTGPSCSIGPGT